MKNQNFIDQEFVGKPNNSNFEGLIRKRTNLKPISIKLEEKTQQALREIYDKPNPDLERIKEKVKRQRKGNHEITYPPDGAICIEELTLKLNNIPSQKEANIYILNDKGELVTKEVVPCESKKISLSLKNYKSGLYYWKYCIGFDEIMGRVVVCSPIYASFLADQEEEN